MYKKGDSLRTISKKLEYSETKVRNYLLKSNVKLRKRWEWGIIKGLPNNEIRKAYLKDVQLKEIAKKYGVHTKTIRRRLKWMGVYKKSRRAFNKRNIDLVSKCWYRTINIISFQTKIPGTGNRVSFVNLIF